MKKKILFIFLSAFIFFSLFDLSLAAVRIPGELYPEGAPTLTPGGAKPLPGSGARTIDAETARVVLVQRIVNVLLSVAGVVAIYAIVTNGFWLITTSGKEESITQHKRGLTWAVLGLVFIILSYVIITFIIRITLMSNQPGSHTTVQPLENPEQSSAQA